jgi:uncharacterized protein YbaR (Trm112 family)
MHTRSLKYLCDPADGSDLRLSAETVIINERVETGELVSANGTRYLIKNGVPRFLPNAETNDSVVSFGNEWNHFNYDGFKANWLKHIAEGGFGSTDYFKDKLIVDCAAGSGMHAEWMSEYGASHVIALELSHSVDGVMRENLQDVPPGERYQERLLSQSILNTFDWYGGHRYQHYLPAAQLATICDELTPKPSQILNRDG